MAYVSLDELKAALNTYDLVPDAVLEDVIETAQSAIQPFLDTQSVGIVSAVVSGGQITFTTIRRHGFAAGQEIEVTGTDYDDTYTIASQLAYSFCVDTAEPDTVSHFYRPMGTAELSTASVYDNVVPVRQATLMVAVDVFNARNAPGGQAQGIDFQPGPYIMGRSIISRVTGLISRYRDVGSMIG